jgi:hypothetical protein
MVEVGENLSARFSGDGRLLLFEKSLEIAGGFRVGRKFAPHPLIELGLMNA